MVCLFKNKEFSVAELIDRLETVKEVLKERETSVTPELLKAVDIAIVWIKNKRGVEQVMALDEALDEMIKGFFGKI